MCSTLFKSIFLPISNWFFLAVILCFKFCSFHIGHFFFFCSLIWLVISPRSSLSFFFLLLMDLIDVLQWFYLFICSVWMISASLCSPASKIDFRLLFLPQTWTRICYASYPSFSGMLFLFLVSPSVLRVGYVWSGSSDRVRVMIQVEVLCSSWPGKVLHNIIEGVSEKKNELAVNWIWE